MPAVSSAGSLTVLFADVRAGAPGARNALLTRLQQNLTRLTAAILTRHFPLVARRRQVESVVQDLNCALLRATDNGFCPADVKEVVTYAAKCLRSLLVDEAEKIRRRKDFAPQADPNASTAAGPPERAADEDSGSVLLQWGDFQQHLRALPDENFVPPHSGELLEPPLKCRPKASFCGASRRGRQLVCVWHQSHLQIF